jgi:uncharacterized protein YfkK (UPF0435 family)
MWLNYDNSIFPLEQISTKLNLIVQSVIPANAGIYAHFRLRFMWLNYDNSIFPLAQISTKLNLRNVEYFYL